jgi:hypothetical protein
VEILDYRHDGAVSVLTRLLPQPSGWAYGGMEEVRAGVGASGSDTLVSRALYRFNVSQWQEGDVTLHLRCAAQMGTPGPVEVYVIRTFGALPDSMTGGPSYLGGLWSLADSGRILPLATPVPNQEFRVIAPDSVVAAFRSADGFLAFMVRLANEDQTAENWYRLVTYDYTLTHAIDRPRVTWLRP